jgi:hypothetical protein
MAIFGFANGTTHTADSLLGTIGDVPMAIGQKAANATEMTPGGHGGFL